MTSIVVTGQVNKNIDSIGHAAIRHTLADGAAYSYSSGGYISSLPPNTRNEVINVYVEALRAVWLVIAAVFCLGFSMYSSRNTLSCAKIIRQIRAG
jgi:hypothetical protein